MSSSDHLADLVKTRKSLAEWESRLVAALGPPSSNIEEFYHAIQLSDGHEDKLKVWRPIINSAAKRPLIVIFHGGGFFCGTVEMATRPGREFAEEFNAVVVSAPYRPAPEHKFPGPVQDGLEIISWLDKHAEKELGANLDRGFVVGGLSAGATLASVVPQQQLELQHKISGTFLAIPWLMNKDIVPEQYKDIWTSRKLGNVDPETGMGDLERLQVRLKIDSKAPLFSPLNHEGGLSQQPRTYIQAGGKDPLRDDAVVYAKLLEDAGIEVKIDVHAALAHDCFSVWANEQSPPELKKDTMAGMAWLLGKK